MGVGGWVGEWGGIKDSQGRPAGRKKRNVQQNTHKMGRSASSIYVRIVRYIYQYPTYSTLIQHINHIYHPSYPSVPILRFVCIFFFFVFCYCYVMINPSVFVTILFLL